MSLLQKSLIKETVFCKRDLYFIDPTNRSNPIGHDSYVRVRTHLYQTHLICTSRDVFVCDIPHPHVTKLIYTGHNAFVRDVTL